MTLEEAIKKAIQRYYDGHEPKLLSKSKGKPRQYDKKYFDDFLEEVKDKKKPISKKAVKEAKEDARSNS